MGVKGRGPGSGNARGHDTLTGDLFAEPSAPVHLPLQQPSPAQPKQKTDPALPAYTIRRSARSKRMRLRVNLDGQVEVVLPLRAPLKGVEDFVLEHADWLRRTQERFAGHREKKSASGYAVKGCVMFRGVPTEVVVTLTGDDRCSTRWDRQRFHVHTPNPDPRAVARALSGWMRWVARDIFAERIDELNKPTGYAWTSLRVADQKTRWGSCSTRGTLSFNWRLLLAPPEVLDYVVIHELAHLKEPNHSRAFWRLVAVQCPEYRQHVHWLKENGHALVV